MARKDEDHDASFPLDGAADYDKTNTSTQTRTRRRGKGIYVEPVSFLAVISRKLFDTVEANVIEVQYCKSVLNIDEHSSCLNHTAPHFSSMQKYASNFLMIQMVLYSISSVLTLIFLTPWSDTFGRRPLILSGTMSCTLSISMWMLATYSKIHPNYFILLDLPMMLGGGLRIILMANRCYICDVTTVEARIFRMGVLTGLEYLGALAASLLFPYLQNIGYSFPLIVCASVNAAAFLYTSIFLEESVCISKHQRKLVSKNPFQWSQVKSIYVTCFTKQPPIVIQILIFSTLLDVITFVQLIGDHMLFYLFLQKTLGWTADDYSYLSVIVTIFLAFAVFTVTSKLLNLTDLTILSLLIGINLSSLIVFYFGTQNWLVYVTAPLSHTLLINTNIVRSFLSKIVQAHEIGKVFALWGFFESVSPILGSPIYTTVYKATLDIHPKAIFLVSAATAVIMAFLCAKIYFLYQKRPSSTTIQLSSIT